MGQIMSVDSLEPSRRVSFAGVSPTERDHLFPPSINEVLTRSLPPSLEDVHRAHAYTYRRGSDSSRRRNSDSSSRRRRSFEKQRRRLSASKRSTETLCAIEALTEQMRYKGRLGGESSSNECCNDQYDDELDDYQSSRKDTLVSPVQSMS